MANNNLYRSGFFSLIWTQFFGAINDNILKQVLIWMLIAGVWKGQLGEGAQGYANIIFTVPFILLSGYAGRYADRNSKRDVVLRVKIIEIPIAIIALVGFWTQNLWLTLAALLALACQSAFFGPAKYGMIPELVESRDLSRANGLMNMMTNIAVITGTLVAGQIADLYDPQPGKGNPLLWLPGVALVAIAIAGLVSALRIPAVKPGDKSVQYELNPFGTYVSALKEMAGTPLFTVMFAWAYFYFVAGLALLILPEYFFVLEKYNVDKTEISLLLGVLGVSIGIGCVTAGYLSGDAIRPRLVPFGGVALAIFFGLLGLVPATLPDLPRYWRILFSPIALFVLGAGISAGFYIVPLQALLQRLTPSNELGRYLGTANGLSFVFLLLSAILFPIIYPAFVAADGSKHPDKIFLVASVFMLLGVGFFVWRVRARGFSLGKVE